MPLGIVVLLGSLLIAAIVVSVVWDIVSPPKPGSHPAGRLIMAGLAIAVAVWYFGIYDTATGRCGRGDLGACFVVSSQQRP